MTYSIPPNLMVVFPIVTLTLGCSSDSPGSNQTVRFDSAGIRIVENVDSPVREWPVTRAPLLDIGSDDDPLTSLHLVGGAHRLSDGRIVVANRDDIRYYSPDGTFQKEVGRTGSGPGEYRYIAWSTRCGSDTVYVYDIANIRLTALDGDGNAVRHANLMLPNNTLPYSPASCQLGGPFVSTGWSFSSIGPGLHRPDMPVGLSALNGDPLSIIGTFPGTERWGELDDESNLGTGPLPLGRDLQQVVVGDRVFVGTGDGYRITGYNFDGKPLVQIRLAVDERPITRDAIDAYVEDRIAQQQSPAGRSRLRRKLSQIDFPEQLPPYGPFLTDPEDRLWIPDYSGPLDDVVTWRRFTLDGRYVGRATLPAKLRVFEIGEDYVLGLWRDELDVEHVRLYGFGVRGVNESFNSGGMR